MERVGDKVKVMISGFRKIRSKSVKKSFVNLPVGLICAKFGSALSFLDKSKKKITDTCPSKDFLCGRVTA